MHQRHLAKWWNLNPTMDRVVCTLCPKECKLKDGQRGFCYLRLREGDSLVTEGYETTTGVAIDPIEKKPLNHFLPKSQILSLGNMGCNLACRFCQNWSISKAKESPVQKITSEQLVQLCQKYATQSVAFTYNDPTIWAEFVLDSSYVLKQAGIHPVLVTAGYIDKKAREELYAPIDAINFDLKGFSEDFYFKYTNSGLKEVLDTLVYTKEKTKIWMELTHLVIPGANDSDAEYLQMLNWIKDHLGVDTVLHLTAFHPDWKMQDVQRTPHELLIRKYDQAKETGFNYVYLGNVFDEARQSTYCSNCSQLLIRRSWHKVEISPKFDGGKCLACQSTIPGVFTSQI